MRLTGGTNPVHNCKALLNGPGGGLKIKAMSAAQVSSPFHSWETVRCELLHSRVCDLGLQIEGSPIEPFTQRLHREFAAKGMAFRPSFYLTDSWGCPDRVPIIGVPFYLADKRLARIEEEQTGEIEDEQMIMMLIRHEAGHTVSYAYRLWKEPGWAEVFGSFSKPYREVFHPQPASREFVRHIYTSQHGRTYAQKHPDEDFAETFAVWLTPRSAWRRRYRYWPALKKLQYVDAADAAAGPAGAAADRRPSAQPGRRNDDALGRALWPAGGAVSVGGARLCRQPIAAGLSAHDRQLGGSGPRVAPKAP